jgi:hypothetical protein
LQEEIDLAEEQKWASKIEEQKKTRSYHIMLLCYILGSFILGIYNLAIVLGGYRCHELRTCTRKQCDIGTQDGMRLPFLNVKPSLLKEYGAFRPHSSKVENGESSFVIAWLMQSTPEPSIPTGQAEWTARQSSGLKYTVDLMPGKDYGDGLPRVVLYVKPQSTSKTAREVSTTAYNIGGNVKMKYGIDLDPCVSTFKIQCQELRPELAFQDTAHPREWVEYIDSEENVFKLVLDTSDGIPDCWSADVTKGNAAGWWYDQMLFGPNITVGSDAKGNKILGFVMQNSNFSSTDNGAKGGKDSGGGQCVGGQKCGAATAEQACKDLGAPCDWGAPNSNSLQRGMKFFSNMTYSLGYGRHSVYTDHWEFNGMNTNDRKKIPSSFATTSYSLDLKIPHLSWLECTDYETCTWSDPSSGGGGGGGGGGGNHPPPPNNGGGGGNHPPPPNNGGGGGNPPPNNRL